MKQHAADLSELTVGIRGDPVSLLLHRHDLFEAYLVGGGERRRRGARECGVQAVPAGAGHRRGGAHAVEAAAVDDRTPAISTLEAHHPLETDQEGTDISITSSQCNEDDSFQAARS